MKNLKGKNCVLTGAASGIGREMAIQLAKEGMNLFLVDLNGQGLEDVRKLIDDKSIKVFTAVCDVANYHDVCQMSEEAFSRMGSTDLLINNAGIAGAGIVEELEPDDWKQVIDVNTWSIIYAVRAFLPRMIERGVGHIVNTGSGAGIVGIPYHIQYVVSKFAVVGISESLYSELKHVYPGINVSVICPPYLNTGIIERTQIKLSHKLVSQASAQELDARADEFGRLFWQYYTRKSPPLEKVVRKYIKGIRKERLYIVDDPQIKAGMLIKGVSDFLYRAVLRREGRNHQQAIEHVLREMGL